jgi:hypothetical protein
LTRVDDVPDAALAGSRRRIPGEQIVRERHPRRIRVVHRHTLERARFGHEVNRVPVG